MLRALLQPSIGSHAGRVDFQRSSSWEVMADCVFCKIVAGEIQEPFLYEDDSIMVLSSKRPLTAGHCLVVPKKHFENIFEADPSTLSRLMSVSQIMAQRALQVKGVEGVNVENANGRVAGQTVFHLHFHVIPRRKGDRIGVLTKRIATGMTR
jgi:histidine triad (HIT) family protein